MIEASIDIGLKRPTTPVDQTKIKTMKMNENEWKWTKMNENWRKWTKIEKRLFIDFADVSRRFSIAVSDFFGVAPSIFSAEPNWRSLRIVFSFFFHFSSSHIFRGEDKCNPGWFSEKRI